MRGIGGMMAAAALLAAAPATASPVESAIEAPGPQGALRGTMLKADGAREPVLILPGSGPTDRDGNNPMGVSAQPYKLLAEALAGRGVTTVRIDKRGLFGSRAAVADGNDVTIADYAGDVHAWVKAIRLETKASCVWLLGHSEGGLVALAAAQRPEGLCGLVLVAAPGRKVGVALREQLRSNPANAPLLEQAEAAIASLEAGKAVDVARLHPALMPLFAPQVQRYLVDLLAQDPAALAAATSLPILIVQGERDIQVGGEDARSLAAANAKARLVMLPGVNHVLKAVASDDRAANLAIYANPDQPLAPQLVEPIVAFVSAAGGGRP
jgi:uncharacterized protein